MSDQINDGGPAFPIPIAMAVNANHDPMVIDALDRCQGGMSLRDYFAGQAMKSGTFAHARLKGATRAEAAVECWADADAMLAARKEAPRE